MTKTGTWPLSGVTERKLHEKFFNVASYLIKLQGYDIPNRFSDAGFFILRKAAWKSEYFAVSGQFLKYAR
jgi:hypothetical protein